LRNPNCRYYSECLAEAALGNFLVFSCDACDLLYYDDGMPENFVGTYRLLGVVFQLNRNFIPKGNYAKIPNKRKSWYIANRDLCTLRAREFSRKQREKKRLLKSSK
jgi:hypothetical protein